MRKAETDRACRAPCGCPSFFWGRQQHFANWQRKQLLWQQNGSRTAACCLDVLCPPLPPLLLLLQMCPSEVSQRGVS
jgi:hypothetical protein